MALRFTVTRILPSLALFLALLAGAVLVDLLLHGLGLAWVGRYGGPAGSALIAVSFLYSARKRKLLTGGSPKALLRAHELLGWTGALLILVHGGIHFNALVPWLALAAMVVVVGSGLTGRFLLEDARASLRERAAELKEAGLSPAEVEQELLGVSLLVDTMKRWRSVHLPLTRVFAGLALVVPVIEEFFLRGFLMRFVTATDWVKVPFGTASGAAILVGTAFPLLSHPLSEAFAVIVWFSLVTWLMLRTRSIWDCVAAHAVTNLTLGIYVVATGDWQLW